MNPGLKSRRRDRDSGLHGRAQDSPAREAGKGHPEAVPGSISPEGEGPLLNMEMIRELMALDDGKGVFFGELVNEFLALAEELIARMETAGGGGDAAAFKGAAHTLKGAGLNIGARALGEHCRCIEKRAPDAGGSDLQRLRALFNGTKAAFSRLRQRPNG